MEELKKEMLNKILENKKNIEKLKKDILILTEQKKELENDIEETKKAILDGMSKADIDILDYGQYKATRQRGDVSIEVLDIDKVSDKYKRIKTTVEVDKVKVKNHYKNTGQIVDGVKINNDNYILKITERED